MLETVRKWTFTLSVAALALAALLAVAQGCTREARAQAPQATAVCQVTSLLTVAQRENWMNEQLRAGKTYFVGYANVMCSW